MLRRMLTVDGLRLEVLESRPTGLAVFFLHENSASADCFSPLMQGPLGREYRMVSVSLPGHGNSDAAPSPKEAYTLPALARTMQHLIARMHVEEFALVGHGLGGHVWLHALPRLPDAAGLLLLGSPPATSANDLRHDPSKGLLGQASLSAEEIDLLARLQLGPAQHDAALLERQQQAMAAADRAFRPVFSTSLATGQVADEATILMQSPVPTALIWGTDDTWIDASTHDPLQVGKWLRDGRYKFWGSGHSPHLESGTHFGSLLHLLLMEAFEFSFSRASHF